MGFRLALGAVCLLIAAAIIRWPLVALTQAADVSSIALYVGYADTLRSPSGVPRPWVGDQNVLPDTCGGCLRLPGSFDTGAIRIDDLSGQGVLIDSVEVDILGKHIKTWSHLDVRPSSTLVLASGANDFDTSDSVQGCSPSADLPIIRVAVGGEEIDYRDTGQVLNTGGSDRAVCSPGASEAHDWQLLQAQPPVLITPPPPPSAPTVHAPTPSPPSTGWLHVNVDLSLDLSSLLEALLGANAVTTTGVVLFRREGLPPWLIALLATLAAVSGVTALWLFLTRTPPTASQTTVTQVTTAGGGVSSSELLAAFVIIGLAGIAVALALFTLLRRRGGPGWRAHETDEWILERAKTLGLPDRVHDLVDYSEISASPSSDATSSPASSGPADLSPLERSRLVVQFLDEVAHLASRGYIDDRFWVGFFRPALLQCAALKNWRRRYWDFDDLCNFAASWIWTFRERPSYRDWRRVRPR